MGIIDYAEPWMKAQAAMKAMHQAMLEKNYDSALQYVDEAIVEMRMVRNSVRHEKEMQVR